MRIGTRGSALALAQSEFVRGALPGRPDDHVVRVIKTTGDLHPQASLTRIGGKGAPRTMAERGAAANRSPAISACPLMTRRITSPIPRVGS